MIKAIREFEALYWATETGEIYSFRRKKNLKKHKNDKWYFCIKMQDNWRKVVKKVCRIIAEEFVEWYFEGAEVNHKDWNKENDNALNLEWVTKSENQKHAWRTWLRKVTENLRKQAAINCRNRWIEKRKLTLEQAEEIRNLRKIQWKTYKEIASIYNVRRDVIWCIIRNQTYID